MSEQQKMDQERAAFEAWVIPAWSLEKRTDSDGDTVYVEDWVQGAWIGWQKARSLPVGVPDGYMPIPTAEQIADALDGVRCYHDMSAELIAPRLLANLLASTTVKAEQVQCEVCHGQGEVYSGIDQHFHYFDFQPPEPIMEVCPECGGEEAISLPAAGSADLTAVRCQCCATEYPHDSYDAGFIAGSGMCQVCDAAIPAVDLPSAAPAEQPYPHGIAEDLERSDWAPLEALQWYAAGKHFDVADGRTRIIDTGAVASNALKHASLAYLELKGDAELSELRAALSAPQSAPERVGVLCEALEDARQAMFAVVNQELRMKAVAKRVLNAEINRIDRALLASHGDGGKV